MGGCFPWLGRLMSVVGWWFTEFSGGRRPAETTAAMSEELSPIFCEPQCEVGMGSVVLKG